MVNEKLKNKAQKALTRHSIAIILLLYVAYLLLTLNREWAGEIVESTWNVMIRNLPEVICYVIVALFPVWGILFCILLAWVFEVMGIHSTVSCPGCGASIDPKTLVAETTKYCPACAHDLTVE